MTIEQRQLLDVAVTYYDHTEDKHGTGIVRNFVRDPYTDGREYAYIEMGNGGYTYALPEHIKVLTVDFRYIWKYGVAVVVEQVQS